MKKYRTLLSLLLSFTLSATSCTSQEIDKFPRSEKNQSFKETNYSGEKEMDLLTLEYYNYFSKLQFIYNYQEKYIKPEEIDEQYSENKNRIDCCYEFNGNIESIVESIKDNSSNNTFFTPENIQILNRVLTKIKINSKSDKNEDFHKLSTIKIAYGNGDDLGIIENSDIRYVAYYDEENNILYLDKDYIELIAAQEVVSPSYYLEYTLEHELNHVRQVLCDCNKELKNTKISYGKYDSFLLESTAESSLYNELNQNIKIGNTYADERIKESEILLLGLFSNDSVNNYYKAIYDVDLEELYNYLDLGEEEIYDFYNIIYAIDGSLCRNNLPYEIFTDVGKVTYGELKKEIGYAYKQNLYKMLIMRMLKYNSFNDLSLEDNLVMHYLIKNLIFYDCYYFEENNETFTKVYPEEIKGMLEMDNKYLEFLATKYDKDIEEVQEIEKIKGYLVCSSLINYIKHGEVLYETYEKQVKRLLEMFPTLTSIINNYDEIYLSNLESISQQLILSK